MPNITDVIEQLPRNPQDPNWHTRPLSAIRYIVVHYDAVALPANATGYNPVQRYTAQARYHINKNWNDGPGPKVSGFGLMYHYRVSADGRIWRTQPEELITWHARAANYNGLAICCDLGPGETPRAAELAGLKTLLDWLCYHRPDIPADRRGVWGHGELHGAGNHTSCPGKLLGWVQAYRKD